MRLLVIEKTALAWAVLTSVLMAALWNRLSDPVAMVQTRVVWLCSSLLVLGACRWLQRQDRSTGLWPGLPWPRRVSAFVRTAAQLAWLSAWYPETFELNRWRDNLDWLFAGADWHLFGCQPSLEFSRWLSGGLWSELFNLGYASYYPSLLVLVLGVAWGEWRPRGASAGAPAAHAAGHPVAEGLVTRVGALVLASFFIYYAIYIALPVAGPQFYFAAIGLDNAAAGIYPHLGVAFSDSWQMLKAPGWEDGLFYRLVAMAQATGERPTAAFPSSHIGISTIILALAWRHARPVVPLLLPLWLLLCCATVYIQAHYVVDAVAGLLSAPLVLCLARRCVTAMSDATPLNTNIH